MHGLVIHLNVSMPWCMLSERCSELPFPASRHIIARGIVGAKSIHESYRGVMSQPALPCANTALNSQL